MAFVPRMYIPPDSRSGAMGNAGPHDPRWIGNKNYGPIFDAVDQAIGSGNKSPEFNLKQEVNPNSGSDKNPSYVPDYRGISPTGWNRVAAGPQMYIPPDAKIDLTKRPIVKNPDGSISTVRMYLRK